MEKNFRQTESYQIAFRRYPLTWRATSSNGTALPLFAPTNASLDEVAAELVKQIMDYVQTVDEVLTAGCVEEE